MTEKKEISKRLREEVLTRYGSIKALAGEIGKSQQYLNIYLSGINAPGPKVRELLRRAGLDVPYIMTGRREQEGGAEQKEVQRIRALMKEKGIRNANELRQRLDREESLARMLGPDVYSTFLQAAVLREKRVKYESRRRRGRERKS
ncbi:MAG: hypothetical protein HYW57_04895 [Ignavibacteriales bacterium]|nr:hypothetical protein [Ignavibacteriales bacterium]